ncbi:carboxypeptidase M32 [Candidatus Woesearchaeota archaeon]|nr:MAG: carboxypeptidase M32 [Candidatus Woesearchaeota archaeon]
MSAYEELERLLKRISVLGDANALLYWDYEVMMPPGEQDRRTNEMAVLSEFAHELFTSDQVGALLERATAEALTPEQRDVVKITKRRYDRQRRVPASLVKEMSATATRAELAWKKAREENDFASFAPHLRRVIELAKRYAQAIDATAPIYQTLLQDYDEGATIDETATLLSHIAQGIKDLIRPGPDRPGSEPLPPYDVPVEKQRQFNEWLARQIGYDFTKGRLDTGVHPMTMAFGRITTRYTDGWLLSLYSTIHEAGHAMYEHNLDPAWHGTPLGQASNLAIHESQSRLLENEFGKSDAFISFLYPRLKESYAIPFTEEQVRAELRAIRPGTIRVNADEVTYNLHVILRFELERRIFADQLAVEELPAAWNDRFEELFGFRPPNDKEGVLQDTHWSGGAFGYFPTYVKGSAFAAQQYEAIKRAMPDIEEDFSRGDTTRLRAWLREHIHRHGDLYLLNELAEKATGKPLTADSYLHYLHERYG